MELDERFEQAAAAAIARLGLVGVEYDSLYRHPDSERVDVHLEEGTDHFGVQILLGGHPQSAADTSIDAITDQIATELNKRQR
jgi:hypothetical protein